MKLITAPSVYVIGRQVVDDAELDRFLGDHSVSWETDTEVAAEKLVETAGRLCYLSFAKPRPGGNQAYLKHILEVGHGSCVEHAVWTLLITGISRSLSHELVRHRAGISPSQLSQRYVDSSDVAFVVPPELRKEVAAAEALFRSHWDNPCFDRDEYECLIDPGSGSCLSPAEEIGLEWFASIIQARESYERITDYLSEKLKHKETISPTGMSSTDMRKAARQAACSVLPNATETKIAITANARALRNFIELRASAQADVEIRNLAIAVLRIMQKEAPAIFGDYQITPLADGTLAATTQYRKV